LGYEAGDHPQITSGAGWEAASASGRAVAIYGVRGYDGSRRAAAWQGRDHLNSVHGRYVLPLLTVARLQAEHLLIALVYTGSATDNVSALETEVVEARWLADGALRVTWRDGKTVEVPPLADG
jgi:hypothetical protein